MALPAPWTARQQRPRVLLLGDRQRAADHVDQVRQALAQHMDIVLEDLDFTQSLLEVEADFAVVLGGDGSILRAAKQMGHRQVPVVGVNLGKLGFLAALSPEELTARLPDLCAGRCQVVDHLMFNCDLLRADRLVKRQLGLNEVAILGGPPFSILDVDLYVDGELATTYSCDGLIISTPVGSTAHSLSAGGPILRKSLQAFVIQPISPHTLTVRPVVDTADRVYEVLVPKPNKGTALVVDGRLLGGLTGDERIRVTRAESTFRMIEVHDRHYYRTLREKLGWGGNIIGK